MLSYHTIKFERVCLKKKLFFPLKNKGILSKSSGVHVVPRNCLCHRVDDIFIDFDQLHAVGVSCHSEII